MADEIETLLVSVRADTQMFARDVAAMKAELAGPFAAGADQAGRMLENALVRALRTGKLGFEDLRRVALSAMAEIAGAAIRGGFDSLFWKGGMGGLITNLGSLFTTLLGAPGKAIGGPVSPGRAYLVGERGPELFVPTASGRIETQRASGGRDVRLSITINAPAAGEAQALKASGRQVARAVRQALLRAED
ncbi:MAG TPA: tail tape measure protein [Allosphingosinicella sp.]|nr:tail tape measure protein [Allosphingosinicella sp.]